MEAIRVIKTVEYTDLSELRSYLGQQVEIIILPLQQEKEHPSEDNLAQKRQQFFDIIDQGAGQVTHWTREELYER